MMIRVRRPKERREVKLIRREMTVRIRGSKDLREGLLSQKKDDRVRGSSQLEERCHLE